MVFAQSTKDAVKFYENKIGELGTNLKDLESIVQGKSNNLRVVEDGMPPPGPEIEVPYIDLLPTVLRQKVITSSATQKA